VIRENRRRGSLEGAGRGVSRDGRTGRVGCWNRPASSPAATPGAHDDPPATTKIAYEGISVTAADPCQKGWVERALGRATTDRERDVLRERLIHRGESALDEAFALAPAPIEGWLARDPHLKRC
jgi:hypothetical protein